MKRTFPLLVLVSLLAALWLSACSSAPVSSAYTAAGDGTKPDELAKTTTFATDDDLNIVVKLGTHNRDLPVSAIFTGPTGEAYSTDTIDADETVGEVLLGLDWEAQGSVPWPAGKWTVEIYVDDTREKTLSFTVVTPTPSSG